MRADERRWSDRSQALSGSPSAARSLWVVPSGEAHESLGRLIADLARRYGTPEFGPHVTLIGEVEGSLDEVLARAGQLAASLRPFGIWLGRPRSENVYFRSLYLGVRRTAPLLRTHRMACAAFGLTTAQYRPHLSLLYGDLPRATKQALTDELKSASPGVFTAESIQVVDTDQVVESWHVDGRFQLG